jgi:hypothetical protein
MDERNTFTVPIWAENSTTPFFRLIAGENPIEVEDIYEVTLASTLPKLVFQRNPLDNEWPIFPSKD